MIDSVSGSAAEWQDRLVVCLIVTLLLTWVMIMIALVWRPDWAHGPLRTLVSLHVGAIAAIALGNRYRPLLISPLFLLDIVSVGFYVCVVWAALRGAAGPITHHSIEPATRFLAVSVVCHTPRRDCGATGFS